MNKIVLVTSREKIENRIIRYLLKGGVAKLYPKSNNELGHGQCIWSKNKHYATRKIKLLTEAQW